MLLGTSTTSYFKQAGGSSYDRTKLKKVDAYYMVGSKSTKLNPKLNWTNSLNLWLNSFSIGNQKNCYDDTF